MTGYGSREPGAARRRAERQAGEKHRTAQDRRASQKRRVARRRRGQRRLGGAVTLLAVGIATPVLFLPGAGKHRAARTTTTMTPPAVTTTSRARQIAVT